MTLMKENGIGFIANVNFWTYFISFVLKTIVGLVFNYFTRKKEFNNKFVNVISSLTFGVYLISDNKYIRQIIWNDIFNNIKYVESSYLIVHIIISIFITIITCLIIEFIRKNLFEKAILSCFDDKIDNFQNNIEKKQISK